jgi:hypothetical protein
LVVPIGVDVVEFVVAEAVHDNVRDDEPAEDGHGLA